MTKMVGGRRRKASRLVHLLAASFCLGLLLGGTAAVYATEGEKASDTREEEQAFLEGEQNRVLVSSILSFDGSNVYKIPAEDVPLLSGNGTQVESFFVSLSVLLTEEPSKKYRGLFFKGDKNAHRTPSIWLLPNSNHITYRVMSKQGSEVWYTSSVELPLFEWTHIVLSVNPRRDASPGLEAKTEADDDSKYVMSLYVNGEKDSEIEMAGAPIVNTGALHIGRDVTNLGMSGLLSQLEVGKMISPGEVKQKFFSSFDAVTKLTRQNHACEKREEKIVGLGVISRPADTCPLSNPIELCSSSTSSSLDDTGQVFNSSWSLLRRSMRDQTLEDRVKAFLELAWKNKLGADGNPESCQAGLFYMHQASQMAYVRYQQPGQQFVVESVALSDKIRSQRQDNLGQDADDSWALENMANGGNVNAALTLGNRHFYGHNGFQKNMTSAMGYFKMAHNLGSDVGSIAYAKMLLRGDVSGSGAELSESIYQSITERSQNNLHLSEAFNGLGYLHFYGHGSSEKNTTAALVNFEKAALRGSSQGALNAALLLDNSETKENKQKAFRYFEMAARDGNALANFHLAKYKMHGDDEGVERNCEEAFQGFWAMAQIGPWARSLSLGLSNYLEGNEQEAYRHYMNGARLGYSWAVHNAIFILDQQRLHDRHPALFRRFAGKGKLLEGLTDNHVSKRLPSLCKLIAEKNGFESEPTLQAWANNRLGDLWSTVDEGKAAHHYREALPHSTAAYFNLGGMHFWGGEETQQNTTLAFELFNEGYVKSGKELASFLSLSVYIGLSKVFHLASLLQSLH